MARTDEDLLRIVGEERKRSLGFGEGDSGDLTARRETGLAYARGDMINVPTQHKVPAPEGRSAVTDSSVADAVETLLPDVLEVFVGGDDIATFIPKGAQDEQAAQDETDFVHHVIFTENDGYLTLYTVLKDAMLSATGVVHWWPEDEESEETKATVPAEMADQAMAVAAQHGMELQPEEQEDGSVALKASVKRLRVRIKAVPSEDFTVAADTVSLQDTHYCAMRTRVRVQDLIADGIDAEKARELPGYTQSNDSIVQARDQAGEHNQPQDGGEDDLRIVEVRAHYIRLLDDDGDLCIYRVLTDSEERVLLEQGEADHIPFAAGTPYMIPHRFYGEGVPDKTIEIQKIKTALIRSHLDSIYFALNQRHEVGEMGSNEFTIPDLMRNAPGMPVRSKTGEAVRPISAGGLNVDILASLEYVSTMSEGRSGIVRNAQGLNPDTLHDTAQGALALIAAANKRTRLIARNFAETLVKGLYLGVHQTLRTASTADHAPSTAKIRDQWKDVRPSEWQDRDAMAIHVGVGSGGKEHDLAIAGKRLELAGQVAAEGGLGTVLTPKNINAQLMAFERAAGTKAPERYWSDPDQMPPQQPKPDPEMAKVQGQLQIQQAKAAGDVQTAQAKAQADAATMAQKHQMDADAAERQAQRDHQQKLSQITAEGELKRYQIDQEIMLKREALAAELQLKRELGFAQAHVTHQVGMAKVEAGVQNVEPGGEPG